MSKCRTEILSNRVKEDALIFYKKDIVSKIANILSGSYGPYGSHTLLKNGNLQTHTYTKDGKTILDNIKLTGEISEFILNEFKAITDHISNSVGDSTTTVVLLSKLILCEILDNKEFNKYPPYHIVNAIENVCNSIISIIKDNSQEFNSDKAYDIAYIASNGDEKIASLIKSVYDKYGDNIYIEPKYSLNGKEEVRTFDGTNLDYPMKSPIFINTNDSTCVIDNPKVYYFKDPIDTRDMIEAVATIVNNNIINKENGKKVGTVIIAPRYSRDFDIEFGQFFKTLENIHPCARPPLCFIESDHDLTGLEDIKNLTSGVYIAKYLTQDNEISYTDMEYLDKCAGTCERIIIDGSKTVFKNIASEERFNEVIDDLKLRITNEERKSNPDNSKILNYNKRINKLKSQMVQIYVNSLTTADKCNKFLILEDVCVSVMNAASNGVGRASGYELFNALNNLNTDKFNELEKLIINIFKKSSRSIISYLILTSKINPDEVDKIIDESINKKLPYNIITKEYDVHLVTTIMSDIEILNSISSILSKLIITNQMLISSDVEALSYNNVIN